MAMSMMLSRRLLLLMGVRLLPNVAVEGVDLPPPGEEKPVEESRPHLTPRPCLPAPAWAPEHGTPGGTEKGPARQTCCEEAPALSPVTRPAGCCTDPDAGPASSAAAPEHGYAPHGHPLPSMSEASGHLSGGGSPSTIPRIYPAPEVLPVGSSSHPG